MGLDHNELVKGEPYAGKVVHIDNGTGYYYAEVPFIDIETMSFSFPIDFSYTDVYNHLSSEIESFMQMQVELSTKISVLQNSINPLSIFQLKNIQVELKSKEEYLANLLKCLNKLETVGLSYKTMRVLIDNTDEALKNKNEL